MSQKLTYEELVASSAEMGRGMMRLAREAVDKDAEIERLQSESASKSEQLGKLYRVCNEKAVLLNDNELLRAALHRIRLDCLAYATQHVGSAREEFVRTADEAKAACEQQAPPRTYGALPTEGSTFGPADREQQAASRWCIHSSPTLCKFPDCECERRR